MSLTNVTPLPLLLMLVLSLLASSFGAMNLRQSGASVTNTTSSAVALGLHPISTVTALQTVIYPAVQAIMAAPMRFLTELMREMRTYLAEHHMRDMFNLTTIRQLFARLPERVATYWTTFAEMEYECIRRTLCDVADLTSTRIPPWANQILLIYFNTFGSNDPLYQAITSGLITHNCQLLFHDCDAKAFLDRFSANVSQSMATTVGPIRDAINELAAVTASTVNSLATQKPSETMHETTNQRAPFEFEDDREESEFRRNDHHRQQPKVQVSQFDQFGHFAMMQPPQHFPPEPSHFGMMQPPLPLQPLRNLQDRR